MPKKSKTPIRGLPANQENPSCMPTQAPNTVGTKDAAKSQ